METAVYAHRLYEKAENYKKNHKKTSSLGAAGKLLANIIKWPEARIASRLKGHVPKLLYELSAQYQRSQEAIRQQLNERERIKTLRETIGTLPQIISEVILPFETANETNSAIDAADREYVTGAITKKLTVEHVEDIENPGEKKLRISIERRRSLGCSMVDTVSSFTIDKFAKIEEWVNGKKTISNEIDLGYAHNCPNTLNIEDYGLTICGNTTDGFNITEYQDRNLPAQVIVNAMKPELDEIGRLLTDNFMSIENQIERLTVNFDSAGTNYDFVSTDTRQSFRSSDLK